MAVALILALPDFVVLIIQISYLQHLWPILVSVCGLFHRWIYTKQIQVLSGYLLHVVTLGLVSSAAVGGAAPVEHNSCHTFLLADWPLEGGAVLRQIADVCWQRRHSEAWKFCDAVHTVLLYQHQI